MVWSPIKYGKIPSQNYNPSLVCVVTRVYILTLRSKHLMCSSYILLAESDSGVKVKKNHYTWGCIVIATLIASSVFPKTVRLNIIMFMFLSILYVPLFLISQLHLTYYFVP